MPLAVKIALTVAGIGVCFIFYYLESLYKFIKSLGGGGKL